MMTASGLFLMAAIGLAGAAWAQPPEFPPFGPGGPGGPGGPPGFGPNRETKLLPEFDKDHDGRLNAEERKAAREHVAKQNAEGGGRRRGPFGRGGPFGPPGSQEPVKPGVLLKPAEVKTYGTEPLYDMKTLRTLFLEFDNSDWEKELADFYRTDVEVPAKLTVDGKVYPGVGVHFRGQTSYMMAGEGRKRSLNLSIDYGDKKQRLLGYRTLNLLNSMSDPTYLRTVLYFEVARDYFPAPKANYVRVVINGENWGVYVNAQQFNGDFAKDFFGSSDGARWKVPGSPMGRGGLAYLGEDLEAYKKIYEIKSKDDPKSWAELIRLCRIIKEAPAEELEKALAPVLDVDGALKFFAVEKALVNNDGFWTRASDYSLYRDVKGVFHLVPHDANETLRPAEMMFGGGGPGMGRMGGGFPPRGPGDGPPAGGRPGLPPENADLDVFAGTEDVNKALLHRLLSVPALRERYLGYVRDVAQKWLTWDELGPLAAEYQGLIAADVKIDTRKLDSTEAFHNALTVDRDEPGFRGPAGAPGMSLKTFVEKRRAYLLNYPAIQKLAKR